MTNKEIIERIRNQVLAWISDNIEGDEYTNGERVVLRSVLHLLNELDSVQQELPKTKIVKVRCVFPFDKTWEKDKIYTCEVWHHGYLNRTFWDVYYDYGKDPKYVQFSTIELLNEEFAIIQEESQVIPEKPEAEPQPRFPNEKSIVDKVFGAGNLESWEYDEAKVL